VQDRSDGVTVADEMNPEGEHHEALRWVRLHKDVAEHSSLGLF